MSKLDSLNNVIFDRFEVADSLENINKQNKLDSLNNLINNQNNNINNQMTATDGINIEKIISEALGGSVANLQEKVDARTKAGKSYEQAKVDVQVGLRKYATPNFGQGTGFVWGDSAVEGKSGQQPYRHVPTDTEIERITKKFVNDQLRRLNPNVNNTFFEYIPMVGLAAQYFEQGVQGVIDEVPEVVEEFEQFNQWLTSIDVLENRKDIYKTKKLDVEKLFNRYTQPR